MDKVRRRAESKEKYLGLLKPEQHYELRGMIEHEGESTSEGHYIAYARENGNWIVWNDEISRVTTWEEIRAKQAYILFWERKDDDGSNVKESEEVNVEVSPRKGTREEGRHDETKGTHQRKSSLKRRTKVNEMSNMEIDCQSTKRRREESENVLTIKMTKSEEKRPAQVGFQ